MTNLETYFEHYDKAVEHYPDDPCVCETVGYCYVCATEEEAER